MWVAKVGLADLGIKQAMPRRRSGWMSPWQFRALPPDFGLGDCGMFSHSEVCSLHVPEAQESQNACIEW